jgi:hypothetical protein
LREHRKTDMTDRGLQIRTARLDELAALDR